MFLSSTAAIIVAQYWNLSCPEPHYEYLSACTLQSLLSSFYFFLIWSAKLASDGQWIRHLIVIVVMSFGQVCTAIWGLKMIIESSPFMVNLEDSKSVRSSRNVTTGRIIGDIEPGEKIIVCFRDAMTLYYTTSMQTMGYLALVGFTSYTVYVRFIPSFMKQLKDYFDAR